MQRDLGRLRVRAVIVHEIPHHRAGEPGEAVLSEVESPLQPEIRHFFQEKIVHSLGSAAYDVELNPDSTSPVPTLILEHLEGRGGSFVQMSQEMARHLYHCQGGLNPVGLFTAVEVSIGAVSALA